MHSAKEIDSLLGRNVQGNGLGRILFVYIGLGSLLMGTYVWGVMTLNSKYPDGNAMNPTQYGAMNLWGSLYDKNNRALLYVYYGGFVCATVGYFCNLGHIVQVADKGMHKETYNNICLSFITFFVSELFWMPCAVSYIANPTPALWWVMFFQLKVSGVAAIVWAWLNCRLTGTSGLSDSEAALDMGEKNTGCPKLGALGAVLFAAHCAILDGCVWSFYMQSDGRFPPLAPRAP